MPRTFTFQADFSSDTLAGVGYALIDAAGVVVAPRATAGVVNLGGGSYGAALTLPDTFSVGFLRWDDGQIPPEFKTLPVNAQVLTAEAGASGALPGGWPTTDDVLSKMAVALGEAPAASPAEVSLVLAAVIAEFESPALPGGEGGTGRRFTPVTETRTFDGTGQKELRVPDIVPGTPLLVSVWGGALLGASLRREADVPASSDVSVLVAQDYSSGWYGSGSRRFPSGSQNIGVTATWGYAATIPADAREAVRGEAAARLLISAEGGVTGLGTTIDNDKFDLSTSAPAQWHIIYRACISRYRAGDARRRQYLAVHIS